MNRARISGLWRALGKLPPPVLLVLVTLVCLGPFVSKPLHIDDPLFIWTAQHIQANPTADFYGFSVNWYGLEEPMSDVQQNPPLLCYCTALAASLVGWSEIALHLVFLLPALAAVLGTYQLAREFVSRPGLAALTALCTPALIVSGTTLMCDVPMLAFWLWAMVFWLRGVKRGESAKLLVSALLIACCALTKYYGVALVPLLFAGTLAKTRRLGSWALFFLIPLSILAAYQWLTRELYQQGLLSSAISYATAERSATGAYEQALVGLSFTGGCILVALFSAPLCWSRRQLAGWLGLSLLLILPLFFVEKLGICPLRVGGVLRWGLIAQVGLFSLGGISLLALAARHWLQRHDAQSLILLLWIAGTFVFATMVNWTISARTLLPIAPAAGILLVRALEDPARKLIWPVLLSGLVSLWIAWADFDLAGIGRRAAREVARECEGAKAAWFQGHWGFQYYLAGSRARPLDSVRSVVKPGDLLITAYDNTNIEDLRSSTGTIKFLDYRPCAWLTTMNFQTRVGFYTSRFGPRPFALGPVPVERYEIGTAVRPLDFLAESCASDLQKAAESMKQGNTAEALRHFRSIVRLKPDWPEVLNNLAWILATHPDRNMRDGDEALQLAQWAARLTGRKAPAYLDTLAAAYAETGRWAEAVRTAERAIELADSAGQTELAAKLRRRLDAYRSRQPWRSP